MCVCVSCLWVSAGMTQSVCMQKRMYVFTFLFIKVCACDVIFTGCLFVSKWVCFCLPVFLRWHACSVCADMFVRVPFFFMALCEMCSKSPAWKCLKVCFCVCEKNSFVSNQVSSLQISIGVPLFCLCVCWDCGAHVYRENSIQLSISVQTSVPRKCKDE